MASKGTLSCLNLLDHQLFWHLAQVAGLEGEPFQGITNSPRVLSSPERLTYVGVSHTPDNPRIWLLFQDCEGRLNGITIHKDAGMSDLAQL